MKNRYADLVGHLASVKISGIEEVENISFVRVIHSTARLTDNLVDLIFPERSQNLTSLDNAADFAADVYGMLSDMLSTLGCDGDAMASDVLAFLPELKQQLVSDADSIYRGDPAATSPLEVILCYPGFFAMAVQRLAHLLYLRGVRYLPRMMTEYAHSRTGIDIHPGAKIGSAFSIDHGTGVVIGETAEIGDRVKIYQGVTIGAKSFEKDNDGSLIRGKKRHPTIGNDCIIYAGATILGGNTVVGDGCVIGGNVWLTHSLSAGERIYYHPFDDKK